MTKRRRKMAVLKRKVKARAKFKLRTRLQLKGTGIKSILRKYPNFLEDNAYVRKNGRWVKVKVDRNYESTYFPDISPTQ